YKTKSIMLLELCMWKQRNLERFAPSGRIYIAEARDDFGFPNIADDLRQERPHTIWVDLDVEDAGDPIRQGNKLAEATTTALGSPLFGTGMPYSYGLSILRKHLDILAPFTFILSNSEYSVQLASAFAAFSIDESTVILHFQHVPSHFEVPHNARIFENEDFKLRKSDAEQLARGRISGERLDALFHHSDGAYERFLVLLNKELGLPAPHRPSPTGPVKLDAVPSVDSAALFKSLVEAESWIEAFEVAARSLPDRVPEIIDRAGDAFISRGLFNQFWDTFKILPKPMLEDERIAYWKYAAALATNRHRRLELEVGDYLKSHDAPELRALVAISIPKTTMLEEAEKAYALRTNSITTRALGFAHSVTGNPDTGIDFLHKANALARKEDNGNLIVATSNELAIAYQMAGKYADAYRWASWALEQFTEYGMNEEIRRLSIIGELVYPAMLIDRAEAVAALIDSLTIPEELHGIPSVEGIISTLGDYAILQGDMDEALRYARINFSNLSRELRAYATFGLVRALIAAGKDAEALEIADSTYCSAYHSSKAEKLRSTLALGMALAEHKPNEAIPYLASAQSGFLSSLSGPYLAQATIYLASAQIRVGRLDDARSTLGAGEVAINELAESGWLLLGGTSSESQYAWDLWNEDSTPLELRFLGTRKIRVRHQTKDYPMRWCEILAVLAYHPEGLNGERLSFLLQGDDGNMSTLKANVSRMRKDVPVSSRPYQIELPFTADFVEMDKALREGRVRDALELYHGPLLPESDAPFVVELRDYLEETLRQAALSSGDAEVLLSLARKLGDDLELWEATSQRLSKNDPLLPLAKAHVKRIQRSWGG
ncbi:MAG TPA: hypothetical protein VF168_09310, partial [Trueperaceae bacterium]